MKNIVLDTNCLLMCLSSRSKFHKVWTSFLNGKFNLCISNGIINEYEEIISLKTSPQFAEMIVRIIVDSKNIIQTYPHFNFNIISSDPDDNKFVDCAIIANADYIVTQDAHFNILKKIGFPKVNVIRIEDFMKDL